ncbi:MAG: (d)CMP kinase [Rikenellaceae bacterium]|nr:(d)CMP kinase [Rikenellaceae bacterium]MDE7356594.1 (d)CMP kinase [Rikenellaceae bacterium]
MKKIIIAIDGYSSCGKSSFAKAIAARMGYIFIDTGAMYRGVTLWTLRHGLFSDGVIDTEALCAALPSIELTFEYNDQRKAGDLMLCGENVESAIRSIEVSDLVSHVSAIPQVRAHLVAMQQAMGRDKGIVMDGRDIGTTVFPHAELKIFMTADADVRALRRYKELTAKGEHISLEEVRRNVVERDRIDQTRDESPLRRADDAIILDNSHMTVAQQMEWFEKVIKEKIG